MPDARADFEAVYRQYLPAVSAYLARRVDRDDVEDLAADVFAIAWRKRRSVAEGEELPWLYRIAAYQVSNHRRRLATRAGLLGILSVPDSAPAADALLGGDPELAAAWRRLAPRHREVLALVVVDGMAVSEAAIALGATPNAVSIRLHRAKRALADELGTSSAPDEGAAAERSVPSAT